MERGAGFARSSCLDHWGKRVGPVKPVKPADMEIIEDVDEAAVPTATDVTWHISQAEKVQQIGIDACLQTLRSLLNGVSALGPSSKVVLVDLFPHEGSMLKAVLIMRQELNIKIKYQSFTCDVEQRWLENAVREWMAGMSLQGG